MKKLLLVLMVVSMLVVAGSAFAATGDVTGHGGNTGYIVQVIAEVVINQADTAASDALRSELTTLVQAVNQAASSVANALKNLASDTRKAAQAVPAAVKAITHFVEVNVADLGVKTVTTAQMLETPEAKAEETKMKNNITLPKAFTDRGVTKDKLQTVNSAQVPTMGRDKLRELMIKAGIITANFEAAAETDGLMLPIKLAASTMKELSFPDDVFHVYPYGLASGANENFVILGTDGNVLTPSMVSVTGSEDAYLVAPLSKIDLDSGDLAPVVPVLGVKLTDASGKTVLMNEDGNIVTTENAGGGSGSGGGSGGGSGDDDLSGHPVAGGEGSGGGCAMGTSAMALAVLGAFVAMRKK